MENHVILVTGSSRGIGAATVRELAKQGARVVLAARSTEVVETIADEIVKTGGQAHAVSCDVADYTQVTSLIKETLVRFGTLTGLVNNAGLIHPIAPFADTDPAAWAQNIQVNVVGAFNVCHAALPHMKGGVIVNLSSGAAHRALEGWSAYCVGKAALAMLTNSLALETRARVYGFSPGVVDTEMQSEIRASGLNEVSRLNRRDLSDPAEVACALAWLFTDEAADLTGQEISFHDEAFRRRAGLAVTA